MKILIQFVLLVFLRVIETLRNFIPWSKNFILGSLFILPLNRLFSITFTNFLNSTSYRISSNLNSLKFNLSKGMLSGYIIHFEISSNDLCKPCRKFLDKGLNYRWKYFCLFSFIWKKKQMSCSNNICMNLTDYRDWNM